MDRRIGLRRKRGRDSTYLASIKKAFGGLRTWMFGPVHDADVYNGLTRPRLFRDSGSDHPVVLGDVIEAHIPSAILADRVRPDETGTLPVFELIMRLAEPIDAVVFDADSKLALEPFDVFVTEPLS